MRKYVGRLIAAALCSVMLAGCGSAETSANKDVVKIKYDMTVALSHPWGQAAEEFKRNLEEKSGGRFVVEIYPSSTSGSEMDSLLGILLGTSTMTSTGGSFVSYAPSAALLEAPWAYGSEEDVQTMIEGEIGTGIKNDFEEKGFHVLWYQLRAPRQLTSNVPIHDLNDLNGRKIRMSGNTLHTNMWNDAGAICSAIALGETFTALSQGVVEMQENPYDFIYDNSFFEVQKYANETSHVYSAILNVISADLYHSLDDEMRGWLDEAAAETQVWVNEYYFAHRDDYRQKIVDAGMTINTEVDREAFKKAMEPAIKNYLNSQGEGLWEMYEQISAMSGNH